MRTHSWRNPAARASCSSGGKGRGARGLGAKPSAAKPGRRPIPRRGDCVDERTCSTPTPFRGRRKLRWRLPVSWEPACQPQLPDAATSGQGPPTRPLRSAARPLRGFLVAARERVDLVGTASLRLDEGARGGTTGSPAANGPCQSRVRRWDVLPRSGAERAGSRRGHSRFFHRGTPAPARIVRGRRVRLPASSAPERAADSSSP